MQGGMKLMLLPCTSRIRIQIKMIRIRIKMIRIQIKMISTMQQISCLLFCVIENRITHEWWFYNLFFVLWGLGKLFIPYYFTVFNIDPFEPNLLQLTTQKLTKKLPTFCQEFKETIKGNKTLDKIRKKVRYSNDARWSLISDNMDIEKPLHLLRIRRPHQSYLSCTFVGGKI